MKQFMVQGHLLEIMKRKLPNINDKSAYLLCGKPDKIKSIQEVLKQNPLSIKGEPIKQKLKLFRLMACLTV